MALSLPMAKRFTSTIKECGMSKAILEIGYTKYVLDLNDAVTLLEKLSAAEVYEEKYVAGSDHTHHIYENISNLGVLKLMSDSMYQMAKLAGKPVK
jgi:hypothetical protein